MTAVADAADLRDRLVPWYRRVARSLPWRDAPSPYHVLLSELMLQQTRVETVLPYFARFTRRWPTLEALAAADLDDVLHAWAGLGYYRRARALHAAAQAAVAAGGLPSDPAALQALPGVGPYTAGAIASIAFGVPAPAVDGNVERVVCRVDGRQDDPRKGPARRALTARVAALTAPGVASEVTQGLMELGATVCTPRSPRCGSCPWTDVCVARAEGLVDVLPRLPARKAPVAVRGVAGVLRAGDTLLLGRRPEGLLGGLWEPVMDEVTDADAEGDAAAAVVEVYARRAGVAVDVVRNAGRVVHVFTHRRLTLDVFEVRADPGTRVGGDGSYDALAFVDAHAPDVALSKLARKVLDAADGARRQPPLLDGLAHRDGAGGDAG
ncbi:MAG: A/G-specific adenine glycosylase [Alphaproteobacteria bacterium]|nr:A/G-specific adenine glycosylase [Alphaproteobacteria bacterium]